jgi:hypothetical protein
MSSEEAKKILALYRPETADQNDPEFAEALESIKTTPPPSGRWEDKSPAELSAWFHEHCASYHSIRSKFVSIPVPSDLKERILSEIEAPKGKVIAFPTAMLLRIAAVFVLLLGVGAFLWNNNVQTSFNTYRNRMARAALEPYSMAWSSTDINRINAYLARRNAPSGFVLPAGMAKAQLVGCAVVQWQGKPVSMICFKSGKPLPPTQATDLWLFVTDQTSVRNPPADSSPVLLQIKNLMTATWSQDGKTYLLAGLGDELSLKKYL